MKIRYITKRTGPELLYIIEKANEILIDHKRQGFDLTLRQLYYQFIGQKVFPSSWIDEKYNIEHNLPANSMNTIKNYKRLGGIIDDARKCGLLDWEYLEDRARNIVNAGPFFTGPQDVLNTYQNGLVIDCRSTQNKYVEIWVEKDAAVQVVDKVSRRYGMPFLAARGYLSTSEAHAAALRFRLENHHNRSAHIIYLGDHDPSGFDMSRDLESRMTELYRVEDFTMHRVALNLDQVRERNLPPDPAKTTDARCKAYIERFGNESWELDAVNVKDLQRILATRAEQLTDMTELKYMRDKQQRMRDAIGVVADNWEEIIEQYEIHDASDVEERNDLLQCRSCESDCEISEITPDGLCESCSEEND